MRNTWPYRVDGELGRVEFPTYQVCQDDIILYDTAREFFTPLGGWERYETRGFKELAFMYGVTERSCRQAETLINRVRHQQGAAGATTLRTSAEREGKQVLACLERTTTTILQPEGFDETGQPLPSTTVRQHEAKVISREPGNKAIDACDLSADDRAEVERNPILYEQPTDTVNISIDDVVVKKQKRHRICQDAEDEVCDHRETDSGRKYVHNTVAHIQQQDQTYCFTEQGVPAV